jgi:hypothetical protein
MRMLMMMMVMMMMVRNIAECMRFVNFVLFIHA